MDEKSSSSSTSEAASRATSVPRAPMAMPMWGGLQRRGASFTPSPVMATTSPLAFSAWTIRSFCSGTARGEDAYIPYPPGQVGVAHLVEFRASDKLLFYVQPDLAPDALRCRGIVSGDHDHADAGIVALLERRPARSGRIGSARATRPRKSKLKSCGDAGRSRSVILPLATPRTRSPCSANPRDPLRQLGCLIRGARWHRSAMASGAPFAASANSPRSVSRPDVRNRQEAGVTAGTHAPTPTCRAGVRCLNQAPPSPDPSMPSPSGRRAPVLLARMAYSRSCMKRFRERDAKP